MPRRYWSLIVSSALALSVVLSASAFSGNLANGKRIFMQKGTNGKACMTCHPKGGTTGDTYKGKDIPDLADRPIKTTKLQSKSEKFLKVQGIALSAAEMNDLLAFVEVLPSQGFGPVPPAWQKFVAENTAN
jgi:cytochrome c553